MFYTLVSDFLSRTQNTLEPGHPDALFSSKKLTTFLVVAL